MNSPLLRVQNLQVSFAVKGRGGTRLRAVAGVSFELQSGESLGIAGESGCGKSTLGRAILGLARSDGGEIHLRGERIDGYSATELRRVRRHMQIVFQDPTSSLDPRISVGASIGEPLQSFEPTLSRAARRERILAVALQVGLTVDLLERYPQELSGGQCQRVAIARAIVARPALVVCDEAVSALDVSIQAQIVNLLRDLRDELPLSLLFISHNLAVIKSLCQRVLVMYLGRVVESASTADLFDNPRHPYTRALLDAVPVPDPQVQRLRAAAPLAGDPPSPIAPPPGCVFHPRCPHAIERCRLETPVLESVANAQVACHRWRELLAWNGVIDRAGGQPRAAL